MSDFRLWVSKIWIEHCQEFEQWYSKHPEYDVKEYFNKYKWWLVAKYKQEKRQQSAINKPLNKL